MSAVDMFSGARGWEALSGVDAVGVELDPSACATSAAAGLLTVRQDASTIDPQRFRGYDGLIASAPCQDWSTANQGPKQPGRKALVWLPRVWIEAIRPKWVALEQVPGVLGVWRQYAVWLRAEGYSVWCGILSAERYGVPQIRKRAVLLASSEQIVTPPEPTHRGFDTIRQRHEDEDLFGLPAALNAFDDPVTIDRRTNSRGAGGTLVPTVKVGPDRPAPTLTVKGSQGQWLLERPARTICGHRTPRWWYDNVDGTHGGNSGGGWLFDRPSTTVTGDPRVAPPGHHDGPQMSDSSRLSVHDAARIQSFPADWPWQGTLSAKHSQIGNAIPPLLAAAILGQLTPVERAA